MPSLRQFRISPLSAYRRRSFLLSYQAFANARLHSTEPPISRFKMVREIKEKLSHKVQTDERFQSYADRLLYSYGLDLDTKLTEKTTIFCRKSGG